ncbi:MAG: hypothetical protein KF741_03445 [Ferruginibacter sp.]|nr:hypothetical protein [Bacteroidota bacterium]MBX2918276.1 hypothetical protein [Ferruginibacter sp.]MCC7380055.1 hypothetical protein [Chitinophagaceae bacterium]
MKKLLLFSLASLFVLLLMSFNGNSNAKQNASDWGQWKKVSCYKGIQFRLSRGEFYQGQYMWNIQFRNLYNKEVRFGWNIVDPEKEAVTRREHKVLDVWRLGAGFDPDDEGNNRDAPHGSNWANSSDKVFVYITNVQVSNNGSWDSDFIDCDY